MPPKKKSKRNRTKPKAATANRSKKVRSKKQAKPPKRAVKKKQSSSAKSSKASSSKTKIAARRTRPQTSGREGAVAAHRPSDFEGLSRVEQVDSESVDELVEEGNAFEAGAVAGVEEADDHDTREVHTHEVPEDDVPDEYLDKD